HEARVLGDIVSQPDHLGLGEIAADVVDGRGQQQVVPQVGVADDRSGDVAVQAGGRARGGHGVGDDEIIGDVDRRAAGLRKEGVHTDAAALADLALGDVVGDGVGLDTGMRDDDADAVALDVDAGPDRQRAGGAAGGGRVDDVPGDGVADDDRVAVADIDAAADPVGLRTGHDVAGDDVVADDG